MNNIYIVDYLGIHCGMHYYLEAFKKVLGDLPECNIRILSNYSDTPAGQPFFLNQYKGKIANKGLALLRNISRLKKFVKHHSDDIFIYLTYGNAIDIPFMKVVAKAPRHIIDIHEAIAQNVDGNATLRRKFKNIYSDSIKTVISHSTRTDDFLKEYGFSGRVLRVPHFKYVFPKDFDRSNIAADIASAVDINRINLLFFGNLNESKGVDILGKAINLL
ncbi:MAG: glycosyltransferase family 1 protein, partial [Muribaculaceae bacterium]|nr:glycosyltransferase family 1 protein [Muribaculaceae bacterium]